MSALVRVAEHIEWVATVLRCRVSGHDWRTWTVVGTDITGLPVCERCGAVDRTEEEDR